MKGRIDRRQGGTRGAVLRATALSVLVWQAMAVGAAAQSTGATVAGTVTNLTTDTPVAGLEVVLHTIRGETEEATETATTDADGGFRFDGVDPDPALTYAVSTSFEDVTYGTAPVGATDAGAIELAVYDPTPDAADVSVATWTVWVDREGEGVAIQHDLEFTNAGTATYIGGQEVSPGERAVVRLALAPQASGFQYLGSFIDCCAVVDGGTFVHTAPIRPGTATGTVRYSAPTPTDLTFPVFLPTSSFSLLVPADVSVEAAALTETDRITDRGVEYVVYTGTGLQAGSTLNVTLGGFGGDGSPWAYAIVGGVVILGAGAFLVAMTVRRRGRDRRRAPAKGGRPDRRPAEKAHRNGKRSDRVVTTMRPRDAASPVSASPASPAEEIDLLVDEIAVLDVALDRGVVDEDTHARLRAAAKARLAALSTGGASVPPKEGP